MKFFKIGKIINTHGLKGMVRIDYYLKDPEMLMTVPEIYLGKDKNEYSINQIGVNKKILLKLKDIDTIEKAERLKNIEIFIDDKMKHFLIEEKDEYFTEEIIYKTGKNDVYEIDNNIDKLIPASKKFIKEIDTKNKKMTVELIEGLIG
jgi:16S rRNA processing protein RimM